MIAFPQVPLCGTQRLSEVRPLRGLSFRGYNHRYSNYLLLIQKKHTIFKKKSMHSFPMKYTIFLRKDRHELRDNKVFPEEINTLKKVVSVRFFLSLRK